MRAGSVVVAVVALLAGPCGAGEGRAFAVPEAPPAESPARNRKWPRVGSSVCAQSQR